MGMISRERVLAALRREEPDRIPYCELGIERGLVHQFRLSGLQRPGESESMPGQEIDRNEHSVEEALAIASFLKMDNIYYELRAPVYAHKHVGADGRLFYGQA